MHPHTNIRYAHKRKMETTSDTKQHNNSWQNNFSNQKQITFIDQMEKKETINTLLQGSDREIWTQSLSNEWGRLAQGNNHWVVSTNTIDFIHQHEVPKHRDVTYATSVMDYRPLKTEPHRVLITVGGDRLL